jgi:hypothetical protein
VVPIALVDFGNTLADQAFFRRDCDVGAVTHELSVDERTRPEQESLEEPGRRVATIVEL